MSFFTADKVVVDHSC